MPKVRPPDWTTKATLAERLRGSVRVLGLGVRLAWRASPGMTTVLIVALALEAALRPVQLALSAAVVDRAVAGGGGIVGLAVLTGLALAAGQVIAPIASTAQSLAGDRLTAYVGEELIRASNRWPGLARFEDPDFQDDLHRAHTRAGRGALDLVVYGARTGLALFTAVSLAFVLARLHPLAPVLLIAATLPSVATSYVANNRTGSHLYTQTPEARRLEYCRDVLLDPEPAKDVRLFHAAPSFRRRYDEVFEETTAGLHRLRRRLTVKVVAAEALSAGAAAGAFLWLVWRIADGGRSPGDLVLYGGAITLFRGHLSQLGFDVGFLPWVLSFLPSLFRVLDAEPDLPVAERPAPVPNGPVRDGIVFEDVSFTYPGRDTPALDGFSLRIGAGECVALVGHNGAGKTTVVKLLLRLYDPTAGRILLDGVDLRELDPADLRRQLSVIFQDFVRYELTAGENIGLGNVARLHDAALVTGALRRAGAESLLDVLPDGLGTALGRQFGGRELSEGEWQQLALARALVRDSAILVLDEPTASLDAQTEFDLYCRFRELTRDRTTLLISHRLSTVRLADRIVFLSGGRVREEGTHGALLAAGGDYARLFRMQASQHL